MTYTRRDQNTATEKLVRFAAREEFADDWQLATDIFWGGVPGHVSDDDVDELVSSETSQHVLFDFFAFDVELAGGTTLSDLFLARHEAKLSVGEREYIRRMRHSQVRLYELRAVQPGSGCDVRDLLTGAERRVTERSGSMQLVPWEIIAARVIDDPAGRPVFASISCVFPPTCKGMLEDTLRAATRAVREGVRPGDDTVMFKRFAPLIQAYWMEHVVFTGMPMIRTADGDDVVFSKAVFDVHDAARVEAALRGSPEIEADDNGAFVWLERAGTGNRILGTFTLTAGRLALETMSESRATRGRSFIERLAGKAIAYRAARVESLHQALAERKQQKPASRRPPHNAGLPRDVEAEVVTQMLDKHYREWVDTPLLALGNRTPRAAAKLKTVRPRLIELLKTLESGAERDRRAGRPAYDVAWMWKELGIDRR